ncbi:hypothetical protein Tco_0950197 [Tanacetum coccineum]
MNQHPSRQLIRTYRYATCHHVSGATWQVAHIIHLLQSQKEKLEQQKAKAKEEVASLKARPSYPDINQLTELLVTSLKLELSKLLALHDYASCLPTELKELPLKFTDMEIKQHIAELKNIQWELPTEFLDLPSQISLVQKKLKTLDSLPSLLNKVTKTLNRFATMVENTSGATTKDVPSAGQSIASPAEGEKNANPATTNAEPNLHDELVDLLGIDVVTQEVVQACPDRKEKGWKTIYGLIKTRTEYLDQTEKELKIDFNKPLQEQDPLNELNDLANKKKKKTGDSTDHSRLTKKQKSSVQHEEEVH